MMCRDFKSFAMLCAWAGILGFGVHIAVGATGAPKQNPDEVIRRLVQSDAKVREQAGKDLLAMGDRAIDAMIEGLKSPDKDLRCRLASLLGEAKREKAIPSLVRMAQSNESRERSSALTALASIGGPEAADTIIEALPRLHPTAQEDYCRILGAIGDNRAIEPLVKVLMSTDGGESRQGEGLFRVRTREAAAEALGKFRDPRARAALVKAAAQDPDWAVYHAARQALYRMDDERRYPQYDELRSTVIVAVARIPEPPEGAKAAIRKWQEQNRGPNVQSLGPTLKDYAASLDIERARDAVVEAGKHWDPNLIAGGVTEILMEYLCGRMLNIEPGNAKVLLIRIGKPAIPLLQNGADRANGDITLVRNCLDCISAIKAAERSPAAPAKSAQDP